VNTYLDGRPVEARRLSRFLVFGLAVLIGVSALTARMFYLQVTNGTHFSALSTRQRTVLEPILATRGLIYDRNGRALVSNVPTFAVKIRPADLPNELRDTVVERLAALIGMDAADINGAIDSNPGSAFDLVRVARDVDEDTARLISEAGEELPGVEVSIEARRQYTDGPLVSQILGYTGPVSAEQLAALKQAGYLPDDLIGKAGVERTYEEALRGTYGEESVERDATGRQTQVLQTVSNAVPGESLTLTSPHALSPKGCLSCHDSGPDGLTLGKSHGFRATSQACDRCHTGAPARDASLAERARTLLGRLDPRHRAGDVGQPWHARYQVLLPTPQETRALRDVLLVLEDPAADVHHPAYARALLDAAERLVPQAKP